MAAPAVGEGLPRDRAQVLRSRLGGELDGPALSAQPAREVELLEEQEEGLVEAAYPLQGLPSYQEAGALHVGDGPGLCVGRRQATLWKEARERRRDDVAQLRGQPRVAAGRRQRLALPVEPGRHDSASWVPVEVLHEQQQLVRVDDGIRVEEQDELGLLECCHAGVAPAAEATVVREPHDLDARHCGRDGRAVIGRGVVDDDHSVQAIDRERSQACIEGRGRRVGDRDDSDPAQACARINLVRVLAAPAFANRRANPYNALLYDALVARGVDVGEFDVDQVGGNPVDVAHLHWPESPLNKRRRKAAVYRSLQILVVLRRLRRRGVRVVWTAHNLRSHFGRYPRAERLWWKAFLPLVDGWISLSPTAAEATIREHPSLARVAHTIVPHGHYRDAYPDADRAEARAALGLAPDERLALFLGRVKPYKGVLKLCEVFLTLPDPSARLLVAGRCDEPTLAAAVSGVAATDPRISLRLEEIPADEISRLLRAADLVVLPFLDVLNSGSALLALSFDAPVLCPRTGALGELADALPGWVTAYDGELTPELLGQRLRAARPAGRPELETFGWGRIAEQTHEFYLRVLAHGRTP
jgi:beta-1,4-mannosyltransferase